VEEVVEEEEEETVFTGRIIKYLNITDIPEGNDDIAKISATKKVFNETFYNQLNSAEKDVYDCLYEKSNKEKPEIKFQVVIEKYIDKQKVNMERVMTSLVFDNPQFWWIESYSITLKNSYKDISELEVMRITILTVDFMTKDSQLQLTRDEIYEMNKEIEIEVDLLLYQIDLLGIHSKYGLLKFIHDYIIRNTVYDDSAPSYTHTIYGPLVKHVGLCSGYSEVLKYVASFYGVNVVIVRSLSHEWNIVHINNKWYYIDVTWDDPAVSRDLYDNEGNRSDQTYIRPDKWDYSNLSHDYFLVGDKAFTDDDHELIYSYFTKSNVIVYPLSERKNYVYSPRYDEYVERIYSSSNIYNNNLNSTSEVDGNSESVETSQESSSNYKYSNSNIAIFSLFINIVLMILIF